MFCKNCGAQIADDVAFCTSCGAPVNTAAEPEAPVIQPDAPAYEETSPLMQEAVPQYAPVPDSTPAMDNGSVVYAPPVSQAPKKKSHLGLIIGLSAAAIIILGIVIAGFLTNWFGLAGSKEDTLAGDWTCEYNATSDFSDDLSQSFSSLGLDISAEDMDAELILTYKLHMEKDQDGAYAYTLSLDRDSTGKSWDSYISAYSSVISEALYAYGEQNGMDRDTLDSALQSQYGYTVPDYVDMLLSQFDFETVAEEIGEDMSDEAGYYKIEDEHLCLSSKKDDFEEDNYIEYKLEGDTLTWEAYEGYDSTLISADTLPIEFRK